jgi:transposase-like protein
VRAGLIVPRPRSSGIRASEKRERIGKLMREGKSYAAIARELGLTKPTVAYHARRLGIPANDKCARRLDWVEVQRVYDQGRTMRECKAIFGFSSASWSAAVRRGDIVPRSRVIPLEELLVIGRAQTNRGHLKRRLIDAGLKEDRCERCGISEWQGRPLMMELHHRNGRKNDNRLRNLELLCGNCHSQTHTWGGRNVRRTA